MHGFINYCSASVAACWCPVLSAWHLMCPLHRNKQSLSGTCLSWHRLMRARFGMCLKWHVMLRARFGAEGGGGGLAEVPARGAADGGVQVFHAAAGG